MATVVSRVSDLAVTVKADSKANHTDVLTFQMRATFDATEAEMLVLAAILRKAGFTEENLTIGEQIDEPVKAAGSAASDAKAIRAWAASVGIEVSAKGRISDELRAAYNDRAEGTLPAPVDAEDEDQDEDEPTAEDRAAIDAE
jgi:hypothetical protein